jgi:protein gp37
MAATTTIEWTDRTWNPVVGCSLVSPGCTNCYAMRMAGRIEAMGTAPHYAGLTQPSKAGPVWTGEVRAAPEHVMMQPLRWRKPARIFVNSMSDLFHESVSDALIDKVFAVMALRPQHTFQVLTKRPARMQAYMSAWDERGRHNAMIYAACMAATGAWDTPALDLRAWPLPNVWLGVSVEDQVRADERIPILFDTPAAVRWISAEPLLGPIDLTRLPYPNRGRTWTLDVLRGEMRMPWRDDIPLGGVVSLDWVVAGGESGPNARPMHLDWVRSLRDQCAATGMPFLFKQWGAWVEHEHALDTLGDDDARVGDARVRHFRGQEGLTVLANATFIKVGERDAGRLLDGVLHDAYPERPA